MKKFVIIILTCLTIFLTSSCKKTNYGKLDYHISGVYLEIEEDDKYAVGTFSTNPAIYYNYQTNYLITDRGLYGTIDFSDISKFQKETDGEKIQYIHVTLTVPDVFSSRVKLFYIMQEPSGNFFVDKEVYEYLDLSKNNSFQANKKYNYNKVNYRLQVSLNIIRKDA